eukprot:3384332-Amphidinium_carterae.1
MLFPLLYSVNLFFVASACPLKVRQLVSAGSNVHHMVQKCPIQEWFAPLHFAAMAGHTAVVDVLLQAFLLDRAPHAAPQSQTECKWAQLDTGLLQFVFVFVEVIHKPCRHKRFGRMSSA